MTVDAQKKKNTDDSNRDCVVLEAMLNEKPNESMESVRNDFALEMDNDGLVGLQSSRNTVAQPTAALNSLRHWGSELR